ncbi:MAG: RNA methyltransferase [Chitinophagaceae bacterium]|nr:RNA methyltransferase [Chitinophagaceae bacterium]
MEELDRLTKEEFQTSEKSPIVVVLENVRSMHNVGSVFRTSDAFLVDKIYLCGFTPTPPHREIQKTALGATESVAWEAINETPVLIKKLKQEGYLVYAVEQTHNSVALNQFTPSKDSKIALVFGNEAEGVSEEAILACDGAIEIPQFGSKHSFNISVSAGIVLWDIFNKMKG